jgi:lipid II:glycine glycyltransferase (peptidoglycan interpeptide bridge formation enzyme)
VEKVKKPLPEFTFFENFYYHKYLGKYLLVKYNDRIVGGVMCPIYKDTIYELYECSLEKDFKYSGALATWAPIEYAIKIGLKYYDFMGAGSPKSNYGVRDFKSKFGGKLVQYGRFLRINNPLLYQIGKWGLKVIKVFK